MVSRGMKAFLETSLSSYSCHLLLADLLDFIYGKVSRRRTFRSQSSNFALQIQDQLGYNPTRTRAGYNSNSISSPVYFSRRDICIPRKQDSFAPYEIGSNDLNSNSQYYEDSNTDSSQIQLLEILPVTCSDSLISNPNFPVKDEPGAAAVIQNLLKIHQDRVARELALNQCGFTMTEDLVLQVLQRHSSDWKPALFFFVWASHQQNYSHGHKVYNEMLDILGKMKRFDTMWRLVKEMHSHENSVSLVTERTFTILLNRYAADHRVEEAIEIFYNRKEFGLELDTPAFNTLLMSLCRYKHVQEAESLFYLKQKEFSLDIRSRNIILNGWCVRGNLREAKRFWNDIIASGCKPDLFTYGIFINSLTKAGKLSMAVKLFTAMTEKGHAPDVAICNCIIDALCFKKKIPDALAIFREMNERSCLPNVATYNCLIKHLCIIRRMEKAYEFLDEMEQKGCPPNARTYNYFFKSIKTREEVAGLLERMARTACRIMGDTYNLILKLYLGWGDLERVRSLWVEMERNGVGPDQRSYTVMVHWFYNKGRMGEALSYLTEMRSKGMRLEPRTQLLAKAIEANREGNKDLLNSPLTVNDRQR